MPTHPNRKRPDCPSDSLGARPKAAEIASAVQRHTARGHASYAVAGVSDWHCGTADTLVQAKPSANAPWVMPAHHYVVRVLENGTATVVSHCDDAADPTCTIDAVDRIADSAAPLVDLVMVDLSPWVAPPNTQPGRSRKDAEVLNLDALMAAVASPSDLAPPRLLVSAVPVEGAGFEGMGGGGASAAFHYLPPSVANAVRDGVFAGTVSAHDRAVYATADITHAVKRSSRAWLSRPMFQVVSGSASLPDARVAAGGRRMRYFRSNTHQADVYSDRPGYAVVYLTPDRMAAVLHTSRRGNWERVAVEAPMTPSPHPAETAAPPLTPCQHCPMIPSEER